MSSSTGHRPPAIDSPMALRYIPLTFDNAHADHSARELACAFDPSWRDSEGEVEIVRFTDGITNTLSKATKKRPGQTESQDDDNAMLLRAYGSGTHVLIDREREMKAHNLLASMGLAPPLLGRFDNGLIYKFVQGQVCTPEDLRRPEVYRAVAQQLGQWHGSLPIAAITSKPDLVDGASEETHPSRPSRPLPNIWTVMQQWIEALPSSTEKERARNHILATELTSLSNHLGSVPGLAGTATYIFSHCDLLSGNVIINQPSGASEVFASTNGHTENLHVSFIDYEYCTPAPAAFDISNHFAEWAGLDCDHSAVPSRSQRRDFLHHYVSSFHSHSSLHPNSSSTPPTAAAEIGKDVQQLYDQVELFRGVPGFFWGIWALIQVTISQIDFDYVKFADAKLGEYWAWKAEMDGSREREGREMPLRERRWAEE